MQNISQQKIERLYFEMFRKDCQLLDGTPDPKYGDKPDVIVEGPRKIGIEITNFYLEDGNLPTSEQRQRKRRTRVVSEAQRIYEIEKGKRVILYFYFDETNLIGDIKEDERLVKDLVELVRKVQAQETGGIAKDIHQGIPELSLVYLFAEVDVKRLFTEVDAKWQANRVYDVPIMSTEKLREIIKGKETKSIEYKKCDAYWLLVVVDWADSAQDQETRIDGFEKIDSESFEKIFVYKPQFGHILEMK